MALLDFAKTYTNGSESIKDYSNSNDCINDYREVERKNMVCFCISLFVLVCTDGSGHPRFLTPIEMAH